MELSMDFNKIGSFPDLLHESPSLEAISESSLIPVTIILDFDPVEFQDAARRCIIAYKSCVTAYLQWKILPSDLKHKILLSLDMSILQQPLTTWSTDKMDDYREGVRMKILISIFDELSTDNTFKLKKDAYDYLLPDLLLRMDLKIVIYRLTAGMIKIVDWANSLEKQKAEQTRKETEEKIESYVPKHNSLPLLFTCNWMSNDEHQRRLFRSLQFLNRHVKVKESFHDISYQSTERKPLDKNDNEVPSISLFDLCNQFCNVSTTHHLNQKETKKSRSGSLEYNVRIDIEPEEETDHSQTSVYSLGEVCDTNDQRSTSTSKYNNSHRHPRKKKLTISKTVDKTCVYNLNEYSNEMCQIFHHSQHRKQLSRISNKTQNPTLSKIDAKPTTLRHNINSGRDENENESKSSSFFKPSKDEDDGNANKNDSKNLIQGDEHELKCWRSQWEDVRPSTKCHADLQRPRLRNGLPRSSDDDDEVIHDENFDIEKNVCAVHHKSSSRLIFCIFFGVISLTLLFIGIVALIIAYGSYLGFL